MNRLSSTFLAVALVSLLSFSTVAAVAAPPEPAPKAAPAPAAAAEVTLKGMLGCGKCSFKEAKACQNVLKVKDGTKAGKVDSYQLADNEVARANHEKVCGPASPATVTGTVSEKKGKKTLTASAITFE